MFTHLTNNFQHVLHVAVSLLLLPRQLTFCYSYVFFSIPGFQGMSFSHKVLSTINLQLIRSTHMALPAYIKFISISYRSTSSHVILSHSTVTFYFFYLIINETLEQEKLKDLITRNYLHLQLPSSYSISSQVRLKIDYIKWRVMLS